MESLSKIIRRLSNEEYELLLSSIPSDKFSKPFIIVEKCKEADYTDAELANFISSSQGAFHTLKSRLNDKIAQIVAQKVDTPIRGLMEEANKISAHVYSSNRQHSIRYLKELEKQFLEYGLFNEIANIHKTIAILSSNREEKKAYLNSYNKHIAYNLALSKAENTFYSFLVNLEYYELNPNQEEFEKLDKKISELKNIKQLHHTHKLEVFYKIASLLFLCLSSNDIDELKMKEIEVETDIKHLDEIFNKYALDEFYSNFRFVTNFLFALYYTNCENFIRGHHFYEKLSIDIEYNIGKPIFNFFIIKYLQIRLELFKRLKDEIELGTYIDTIEINSEVLDEEDQYVYINFLKSKAIINFYQKNYKNTGQLINTIKSIPLLKNYQKTDIEIKLFSAFLYNLLGETELSKQNISSCLRILKNTTLEYINAKEFIKFLKITFKPLESEAIYQKLKIQLNIFQSFNLGNFRILGFLNITDENLRKLADKKRFFVD